MSEIKKNIETCRGEDVLAEVSAAPQDPHFGSLVNEALDPLKQQALHQAGYDGYSEVIEQHKPYTFASAIIQMKSNMLLLLRALWQFPFGSGTLRSLADMWQHYITRLQGNETYGIPSRLSSLTDLPSAPLLVADRKISEPNAIDGMSLIQQIAGTAAASMTSLVDNTHGWTMRNNTIFSIFPAVEEWTLNCKDIEIAEAQYGSNYYQGFFKNNNTVKKLNLPDFEGLHGRNGGTAYYCYIAANCANIEEVHMPTMFRWTGENSATNTNNISQCPKLWWVEMGDIESDAGSVYYFYQCPKLRRLEFKSVQVSINLSQWVPDSETLAHQDFLPNFRTYIALRLADNGSGKTLTLSAAVFSSIWDANGNPQVLGDGLDQLRADIHNIVKTTKHWDVNKAS